MGSWNCCHGFGSLPPAATDGESVGNCSISSFIQLYFCPWLEVCEWISLQELTR